MSNGELGGGGEVGAPSRRKPWRRNTFRGFAESRGIPLRRVLRQLRAGELPSRVGWVKEPTSIREYARLQGIDRQHVRKLYQEGVLPPMVMPHPRGSAKWPAHSGIAELTVLYGHAEHQLRAARREADAYVWRLADLRRKTKAAHKLMLRRLKGMRRRVKLFEGALRSRDVVLSRLKHEATLGRALDGAKTVEQIVRRSLSDKAWENLQATTHAGEKQRLARAIRAAGRKAEKDQAEVITNGQLR
jgi:hypothetical protein